MSNALEFFGERHLRRWLEASPDGRRIISEMTEKEVEFRRRAREQVLVVLEPDGWVEVYGSRGVNVAIRNLMDVPDMLRTDAEEYLALSLPKGFRRWYWPRHSRQAELLRRVTPESEREGRERIEELAVIREIGVAYKQEAKS